VADPVIEGRSLVLEAIRALAVACRARAAYPAVHPNVTQAVSAAQASIGRMVASHGSVGVGVGRAHLRVGVWTLDTPQARALAQALYLRQVAVLRIERGVQPDEVRALVHWLASPIVPLEPGTDPVSPPGSPPTRHLRLQPLDYSAVRLTDRADAASGAAAVSLADRLLNVLLLEWVPDEPDWDEPGTGEGPGVPAEVAMVRWLTAFLRAQAAAERTEAVADGAGADGAGGRDGSAGPGGPSAHEGAGEARDEGGSAAATIGAGGVGSAGGAGPAGAAGIVSASGAGAEAGAGDAAGEAGGSGDAAAAIVESLGAAPAGLLARLTDATTAHLQSMSGAGRVLAARQTAQLIMRLPETLRDSLMRAALRALAPDAEGGEALEAFASTFAAHPVLRVMRQLAAEGVAFSRHAQRLVELLASTRPTSDAEDTASPRDLEVLRSELITLFREEDIDRYNPEDHLALLARSMLAWPTRTPVELGTLESLGERVGSLTEEAVGRQLTETLLDLLGRQGDDKSAAVVARLEQLIEGALARGSIEEAAAAIQSMARLAADETAPAATRAALRGHLERLTRTETLSVLAAALGTPGGASGPAAVRLIRLLGPGAIRGLLQVLVEEQVRVRRRRVFDLLSTLGADVVPEATRWLGDPNWYVVRNMISLLRSVGDRSSLGTIRRLTSHADLRVRLEALRSLLDLDPAAGHGYLVTAIAEPDLRTATAAVELAGQHGGPAMIDPLLDVLAPWDLRGRRRPVRVAALQALGRIGRPEVLPRLGRFFRERWGLFPSVAERRAAYESLQGYSPDARYDLAERGARSRDQEIRAICERLRRTG
jgi:hypothetical protein